MGCNYYLHRDLCECCGRADVIHIGKSSGGWTFQLHVSESEEDGLPRSLEEWKRLWSWKQNRIVDEYGAPVTPEEMLEVITDRRWDGDSMSDEWLRLNGATLGPNGLARSRIGGSCVGHGRGTWDLITGDFL
jgi:hypothetical protein